MKKEREKERCIKERKKEGRRMDENSVSSNMHLDSSKAIKLIDKKQLR